MYYNNELLSINPNISIIPSWSLSLVEDALYVAEENERVFNDFCKDIGINELAVFESTGSYIVYEGANLDKIVSGFKAAVQKIWANFKAWYEKALEAMNKSEQKVKSVLMDKTNIIERLKNVNIKDNTKSLGKVNISSGKSAIEYSKDIEKNTNDLIKDIENDYNKLASNSNSTQEDYDKFSASYSDKIISTILGSNDIDKLEDVKPFLGKVYGSDGDIEITGDNIKSYISDIQKYCIDGVPKKLIKSSYTTMKHVIDNMIKSADNIIVDDTSVSGITQYTSLLKDVCNAYQHINAVLIEYAKSNYTKCVNVWRNALQFVKDQESVKEAAEIKAEEDEEAKNKQKAEDNFIATAKDQREQIKEAFNW